MEKYERSEFDKDAVEAKLPAEYETRIATLERLVGRQAFEIEILTGRLEINDCGVGFVCDERSTSSRAGMRARNSLTHWQSSKVGAC